jgi:hypothetical protein
MNEENLAESDNSVEEPQTDNQDQLLSLKAEAEETTEPEAMPPWQAKSPRKSLLIGVIGLIGCRNHIGPQKMGQILRAWQQNWLRLTKIIRNCGPK